MPKPATTHPYKLFNYFVPLGSRSHTQVAVDLSLVYGLKINKTREKNVRNVAFDFHRLTDIYEFYESLDGHSSLGTESAPFFMCLFRNFIDRV